MSQDLRVIRQTGPAKGVDESENPREGTVAEAFNIETCDGVWRGRPGITYKDIYTSAHSSSAPDFGKKPRVLAEYIPDFRFEGSHYHAMVCGGGPENVFYELIGVSGTPGQSTLLTGHLQTGRDEGYTWTDALWRITENEQTSYYPALLFSNGVDIPFLYLQKSGSGEVRPLDAIDGQSGTTYLSDPPRGKLVSRFKDRYFMGNLDGGAGNRIAWTGPDSALAFPCNTWPSSYNLDVGGPEELTAFLPWKGVFLMFKKEGLFVLSGDGVGGLWNVEEISRDGQGALGARAVVSTDEGVFFYNHSGVYVYNGRSIKNISHPRLRKTWAKLDWSLYGNPISVWDRRKYFQALHDRSNRRVLFSVSIGASVNTMMLVYNYGNDSWDVWGMFPENVFEEIGSFTDVIQDVIPFLSHPGFEIRQLCANETRLFFPTDDEYLHYLSPHKWSDEPSNAYGITWIIKTHPMTDGDEYFLLRNVVLDIKKTGNWTLSCVPFREGESLEDAMIRNTDKHNFIVSALSAQEHTVDGTSDFQTVADGPVDVWFLPQLVRYLDSVALVAATASNKIKFAATRDFLGNENPMPGSFLVVPEDSAQVYRVTMYDSDQSLYQPYYDNTPYGTYDSARIFPIKRQRVSLATNVTGRQISLLFTNMGDEMAFWGNDYSTYVVTNPIGKLDCKGWEAWVRKLNTRRGGS